MGALAVIILLNYNGEKDTIECLNSLKRITYENYLVLVIDNHSSNQSVQALRDCQADLGFEMLEANENNGFSAGNNIGIKFALEHQADYIVLLNNDTLVEPDFLEKLLEPFQICDRCGLTTGTIYYENDRKRVWCAGGEFNQKTFKVTMLGNGNTEYHIPTAIKEVSFSTGCCMCIKAELLESIGFLDERFFLYEEDTEFCYRVIQSGWKIYYAPQSIVYHKVSSSTGGGKKASPLTQYYMVRNKMIFISEYARGLKRIRAYMHSLAMYGYYCLKGYMDIRYAGRGIWDFRAGIKGKIKWVKE